MNSAKSFAKGNAVHDFYGSYGSFGDEVRIISYLPGTWTEDGTYMIPLESTFEFGEAGYVEKVGSRRQKYLKVSLNFAETPLKSPIVCDVDSPQDFYISLTVDAWVSLGCSGFDKSAHKSNQFTNVYGPKIVSSPSPVLCYDGSSTALLLDYVVGPAQQSQTIYTSSGGSYSYSNFFQWCMCGYDEEGFITGCSSVSGNHLYNTHSLTVTPSNNFFIKLAFGADNAIINIPINGAHFRSQGGGGFFPEFGADGARILSMMPDVGSFSFTIEAKEFLEYDDGNGNPIYDTNTGAILRDPVTGIVVPV